MEWRDLVIDGCGRVLEIVEPALAGTTKAEQEKQPRPDCNSMGWIMWHLTRGMDSQIADLIGEPQIWIGDKWHEKFKRPADADDTGFGHTAEEVSAFKSPGVRVLLAYYRACLERTTRYLKKLTPKDLGRELDEPWYKPAPTVGVRLVSIMADCLEHAGEIAYLRGLLKGRGWMDG